MIVSCTWCNCTVPKIPVLMDAKKSWNLQILLATLGLGTSIHSGLWVCYIPDQILHNHTRIATFIKSFVYMDEKCASATWGATFIEFMALFDNDLIWTYLKIETFLNPISMVVHFLSCSCLQKRKVHWMLQT